VPVGVQIIRVESAEEMYEAVLQYFDEADIVIKSAAVSDYRPKKIFQQKMKKQSQELVIELERTVDILAELGKRKKAQFLIGFAAETNHVEEYAKQKLLSKNADMIVANNVMQEGAGFGTDTNIVTFYKANNEKKQFPKLTKHEVAYEILKEAYEAKKGE
jgi:phosphopantothenoylcysteine decarboxylase/phosphopantothenate--cysteine ligase